MTADLTQTLKAACDGDQQAADALMPIVYEELKRRAAGLLRKESRAHTLQATALVNEAFLKICGSESDDRFTRSHFISIGAQAMRHILVDHARSKARDKRGRGWIQIELRDDAATTDHHMTDVLALDEMIQKLHELDPRPARIIEMRFFGGLSLAEIADLMHVSLSTVEADWRFARAWLRREISESAP